MGTRQHSDLKDLLDESSDCPNALVASIGGLSVSAWVPYVMTACSEIACSEIATRRNYQSQLHLRYVGRSLMRKIGIKMSRQCHVHWILLEEKLTMLRNEKTQARYTLLSDEDAAQLVGHTVICV